MGRNEKGKMQKDSGVQKFYFAGNLREVFIREGVFDLYLEAIFPIAYFGPQMTSSFGMMLSDDCNWFRSYAVLAFKICYNKMGLRTLKIHYELLRVCLYRSLVNNLRFS